MSRLEFFSEADCAREFLGRYWTSQDSIESLVAKAFLDTRSGLSGAAVFVMDEEADAKVVVMRVEDHSGSIVKLGYLKVPALSRKTAYILGGGLRGVSEVNAPGFFKQLQAAVLAGAGIDRLVMYRAPEDLVSWTSESLHKHRWRVLGKHQVYKMAIRESPEMTIAHLKKKRRYNIKRQLSKILENSDSCIRIFVTQNEVDKFIELIAPVQLKTYQNKIAVTISNSPARRGVLRSEAARGNALNFALEIEGQIVAFQVGSIRDDVYILEELGFDREFENSSPGMSLLFASFDELSKRGLAEIDFGVGTAQYKSVLATDVKAEYALVCLGTRLRPRVDSVMLTIAKSIDSSLRSLISSSGTARLRGAWRVAVARRNGPSADGSKGTEC